MVADGWRGRRRPLRSCEFPWRGKKPPVTRLVMRSWSGVFFCARLRDVWRGRVALGDVRETLDRLDQRLRAFAAFICRLVRGEQLVDQRRAGYGHAVVPRRRQGDA